MFLSKLPTRQAASAQNNTVGRTFRAVNTPCVDGVKSIALNIGSIKHLLTNTALPVDTTVFVRACAAHGQARNRTSCLVVEVPLNASLRDLLALVLLCFGSLRFALKA